jgi:2-oxoglutarate ferredoxin oxidoreductase subunit beta
VFNDGAFEWATDRQTKTEHTLELEHGKPLIFGKNRDKGIRMNGVQLEVVQLGKGISEDDLVFHDEKVQQSGLAYLLSRMQYPDFPEPIGVFRDVERPIYDSQVNAQVAQAQAKRGEGDLEELFNAGDTWMVE